MADNIEPISHLEKVITGDAEPISHLEQVIALYGGTGGSGGSGTTNYNALLNKPSINGVELRGNKTLADLGITNYDDTQIKKDIAGVNGKIEALKTSKYLEYEGESKICNNTLASRTSDMFIKGKTYVNLGTGGLESAGENENKISILSNNNKSEDDIDYKEYKKEILLPVEGGLKSLPNGVADTIEQRNDGVYLVQRVKKMPLYGSVTLNYPQEQNSTNTVLIYFTNTHDAVPNTNNILCNALKSSDAVYDIWNSSFDKEGIVLNYKADLLIRINKSRLSTVDYDGIKKFVDDNQLTVYYALKTPIETKLDINNLDLEVYKDTTYVTTDNTIQPTLSFKVPSNIGGVIQENAQNVNKLYKLVDDTQVKKDIADLDTNKQDKTDNALDTTDKTVTGAINEVNGNLLDNVTFSSDYKNIIINRKSGLNPYTIPIASIIHNAKLIELNDVDSTNIGDGKTLVYDGATKKHKYVSSTGTDELVKMDSTTDAKHLSDLIDKNTVVNDNGVLKVKKLDGQNVTIAEINRLKGLTMNVMDLVNSFANGGVKVYEHTIPTHADLLALDRSGFIDGIKYFVYVQSDETHGGAKTTYLCDKKNTSYFCVSGDHRDFTTNPLDLANEVTGKLATSNIDVDALWKLLTINDTYKTLTTKNEVFGTHGAKALYDELVASIGKKANSSDLTSHTGDTNIHVTTADKTKWNKIDNKVDKTDIIDNLTSTNTDKPLSAKQGKVLNDKKVDKTSILTAISASPSDNNLLSEKAIDTNLNNLSQGILISSGTSMNKNILLWDVGHYYFNANLIWQSYEHIPNTTYAPHVYVTSVKPIKYKDINLNGTEAKSWFRQIKVEDHLGNSFIRTIYTTNVKDVVDLENGKLLSSGTDTGWQRVSTSVADKRYTGISASNITNATITDGGALSYSIKNGICYVRLNGLILSGKGRVTVPTGTFPIPDNSITNGHFPVITNNNSCYLAVISSTGGLSISCDTGTGTIYTTFSYPVAEQ